MLTGFWLPHSAFPHSEFHLCHAEIEPRTSHMLTSTLPAQPHPSPWSQAGGRSCACQVLEQSLIKGHQKEMNLAVAWDEQPGAEGEPWRMQGPKQEVATTPQKRERARADALKRLWSKEQNPHSPKPSHHLWGRFQSMSPGCGWLS